MKRSDEIYAEYLEWCVKNLLPPLNPLQYEKVLASIKPPHENNIDAIIRNNNPRKDKPNGHS